ncbi:MAG TPA: DUF1761 domain-containing protein [Candidatus Didemnitutus sp.]|nr:DUF1761 domain-containing protein [Candidatus Didemnitutus sp.]
MSSIPLTQAIASLNYVAVLTATVAGFMLGWLWYSPVLFAKPWMAEMKITEETMKEAAQKGMAHYFIKGFLYTLLGTFGLAVLLKVSGTGGAANSAVVGAFVGFAVDGARLLNTSVWENRSLRLLSINLGHEVGLFMLQGAVLGAWH